jgi:DNA-binding response OmpR family regulator
MARILVVDDEPDVVEIVSIRLERDGHTVLGAADGRAGLDMAMHEKPDLIILDLMMPGLDGYEVLYQMRHNPITEDASVILLTARGDFPSIYKGWDKGADNYVTKPFDVDRLAEMVQQALAEHDREKAEAAAA